MGANIMEWLHLLGRWFHLIAGISWIGTSFYFMWLDSALVPAKNNEDGKSTGETWLVHSGGYYHIRKNKILPGQLPETLHWFKWEAGFTWLSGIYLLTLVYYHGGGAYLLDPDVSSITVKQASALGIGLIVLGWLVYDKLWESSFAQRNPGAVTAACAALLVPITYGLCHVLSGRGAFIHVGALLGTLMVGNVFMRIIPGQRKMIEAAQRGVEPDHSYGERAKHRSVHNNYMTFPVLAIMLSNHFPSTYGHPQNWLVLILLMLVGAGVRHFMNLEGKPGRGLVLIPTGVVLVALVGLTGPRAKKPIGDDEPVATPTATPAPNGSPAPAGSPTPGPAATPAPVGSGAAAGTIGAGSIRGRVRFEGAIPASKEIALGAGCAEHHPGPLVTSPVMVKDGFLAEAFVWIKKGLEGKTFTPPETEVVVRQKGCVFTPHVVGVQVGQKFTFVNDDPVMHNVNSIAVNNSGFNQGMGGNGERLTKTFTRPEVMIRVKCDVHPWMSAQVGVVAHPHFATTGPDGSFSLGDVPPGEYVVAVWHEATGTKTEKVTVTAGGAAELVLTVQPK